MKRIFNGLLAVVFAVCCVLPVVSCGKSEEVEYLNVYNAEEYISEEDDDFGTVDVLAAFEEYATKKRGHTVKVRYSTFGTLENMYNELQLTKHKKDGGYVYNYDLVCPSDYMIQRMIAEDMLEKFDVDDDGKYLSVSNYNEYASGFITDLFESKGWNEYAVGYMWGTMGFIYNPEIIDAENAAHWDLPWNVYYKNLGTIKDSIRDTYALAVGYVYRECLSELNDLYTGGEIAVDEYRDILVKIFNNVDSDLLSDVKELDSVRNSENKTGVDKAINAIKNAVDKLGGEKTVDAAGRELKILKNNVYGFEVDSGKKDMAAGKIAINFAWSGDAAYTLDLADEDGRAELYYAVPEEGSNIWFDAWVMPKGANKELAQMFVDFLSIPEIAISNMDYIGYVSPIAGEEVFEHVCNSEDGYDLVFEKDEEHPVEIDYSYFFTNVENAVVYSSEDNIGRQLTTQYPTKDVVDRCAIMTAFTRHELKLVNEMWSDVKVGNVPTWLMIFIPVFLGLVIIAVIVLSVMKKRGVVLRLPRRDYGKLVSSERIK